MQDLATPDPFRAVPSESDIVNSLRRVALGLGMVYASLIISILAIIAMMVALFVVEQPPLPKVMPHFHWMFAGTTILSVVGTLLCLATPEETGSTPFIYGSVVFMLVPLGTTLAYYLGITVPSAIQSIGTPCYVVSSILFVLFLRRLAKYLLADDLARRALQVLVAICVLLGLSLAWIFAVSLVAQRVAAAGRQADQPAALGLGILALGLLTFGVGIYAFLKYVNLLSALRKRILAQGFQRDLRGTLPPGAQ